jgi:hypothetical protein
VARVMGGAGPQKLPCHSQLQLTALSQKRVSEPSGFLEVEWEQRERGTVPLFHLREIVLWLYGLPPCGLRWQTQRVRFPSPQGLGTESKSCSAAV